MLLLQSNRDKNGFDGSLGAEEDAVVELSLAVVQTIGAGGSATASFTWPVDFILATILSKLHLRRET